VVSQPASQPVSQSASISPFMQHILPITNIAGSRKLEDVLDPTPTGFTTTLHPTGMGERERGCFLTSNISRPGLVGSGLVGLV